MSDLADAIVERERSRVQPDKCKRCAQKKINRLLWRLEMDGTRLGRDGCAAIEAQIARLEEQL